MRHEYTIWGKGPEWAWNVLTTMLLASNPASFRAYYRNYQTANRYWDAPDGRRYWRGRFEIDRGKPDGVGQRRVRDGGKPSKAWDGPLFAPAGIGLYDRDEDGRWWPTYDALASGYLPCASCAQTNRRAAIVASPKAPQRVPALIGAAASERGRPLTRDELAEVLQQLPIDADAASFQDNDGLNRARTQSGGLVRPGSRRGNWHGKQKRAEGRGRPETARAAGARSATWVHWISTGDDAKGDCQCRRCPGARRDEGRDRNGTAGKGHRLALSLRARGRI